MWLVLITMCPYSLDLRQRIVDAYRRGEDSVRGLAKRFEVSPTTVQNYLNLERSTGDVAPLPHGGGIIPIIDEAGLQTVRALVEEKNDRTLDELIEHYDQRQAVQVSRTTMFRAVRRAGLTRKKKRFVPASRIGPRSNERERASGSKRRPSLHTG
jgi:transposase